MTTNLKWRLSKLPTPEELRGLVNDKIITQEEARDILFKKEEEPSNEALKSEIEFLRKLVDKLSSAANTSKITEYIYSYPRPSGGWYQPYYSWCSLQNSSSGTVTTTAGYADTTASLAYYSSPASQTYAIGSSSTGDLIAPTTNTNFSDIKTF